MKVYIMHSQNNSSESICASWKEVEWMHKRYPFLNQVTIYRLDDAPFDMLDEGIRRTFSYEGEERL